MKFGFPMAFTITTVAWGMIEFVDAYEHAGESQRGLEMIKWATDYFIAAHPSKYELYAQVGFEHLNFSISVKHVEIIFKNFLNFFSRK